MSRERVVGIVLYGGIKEEKNIWKNWISYAKTLSSELGCKLTHFGILCDSLDRKDDALKTLSRSEKRLLEIVDSDKRIDAISLYALKKGFTSVLDNEMYLILNSKYKYVYCEVSLDKYNESLGKRILGELESFIDCKNSEIFSMERNQVAFNYVMKGKGYDISQYPTLEILYSEP